MSKISGNELYVLNCEKARNSNLMSTLYTCLISHGTCNILLTEEQLVLHDLPMGMELLYLSCQQIVVGQALASLHRHPK